MAVPPVEKKKGAPGWMVSFGDMMTLILTFFILLVALAKEQQVGLIAKGVGSFVIALRSFGLPGILDASEEASIHEGLRMRFTVPPEDDPEQRPELIVDAENMEVVRAMTANALAPHREQNQPAVATFAGGSAELSETAEHYLDMLALTLRPAPDEILQLEGHALDAKLENHRDHRWLAFERARTVAEYLIEEHGFPRDRVEVRAWAREIGEPGPGTQSVDARLVIPDRRD